MTNYMRATLNLNLYKLIEYSNAMETRINALIRAVKNTNPKSDDNFDRNTRPSYTSHHTE